jgi:opacity protein-like surface antigen
MRKLVLLLAGFLGIASLARAQETPAAEFSVDYSYLRAGFHDGLNLHGGSVSVAGNVNRWFGVVGDYGLYHTQPSGFGGVNFHTFMAGPRFSYRESSRVTPFAQVLLGGFHGLDTNGFSMSTGGGVDLNLSEHIAVRPVQVEYLLFRAQGDSLHCARVSAGIVFRFGSR